MTTHPIDRDHLRKLADDATPGPWSFADYGDPAPEHWPVGLVEDDGGAEAWTCDTALAMSRPDAEFIAAARTAVPALLDENAALRARIQAVREMHKRGEVMAWQEDCTNPEAHDCMDDPHGGGMLCTDEILGHYCHGCAPEDAANVDEYPWPCPTIRALDG